MSQTTRRVADLSSEEKRALLARLIREKQAGRAADPPVHRLFEAQAGRTPDALAVGAEGRTLTYAALNERANRLAHHLRGLGVGPEMRVGVCVERGPEMLVGLLGVLKAGGAYVPLDPAFPPARVAFMLDDARVPVLVTQEALRGRLAGHEARVVCLDSGWDEIARGPANNPDGGAAGANLAYAIYTSGSTGTPKGVMIPHRALTNFLLSMRQEPGLSASDTLLAVTTLSFDIAALELFLPLTVGARVEIASREVATDGARLADRIKASGVTVMQATPASWRLLLESGWKGNPGLTVLCGGEPMTRDLADRLLEKSKAVWNLYGPTETTVWSTLARVEPGPSAVTVGRPVAQTRAYILDRRLRPVPVGVTGELYLGGAGVARGYLDRPGLTAERFLPDPFADEPGSRMYRTGDLARYRPDGQIDCLGRGDGQVKVRGYRVELGEIEAALSAHPALAMAAATALDEPGTGEKRLVGYLVPRGEAPAEAELRAWLRDRLPEYMIPSAFVTLDELPLTPNGKVDRKALPEPSPDRPAADGFAEPPRGPVEEALAAVWSEVLGREVASVHDNFFEVGGHSLMATQLLARVRDMFGVDLALAALLDSATVARLGRRVEDALRSGSGLSVPPLEPVARNGPVPASFAQQRLWYLDQLEPGRGWYNVPTAVRLTGPLDLVALERAFNELARRHEALRTTFTSADGQPLQVIAPELTVGLPLDDLTGLPEAEREPEALRRARAEAWRPFDLAGGPLIRTRLYRLGPDDHLAVVTTHHIVSDGWSIGVLVRETGVLYEAFASGKPSPLPPLPVQYADFAAWQRDWLRGDVLDAQLAYWREALAGVPALELPSDRPGPPAPGGRGGQRTRVYPKALAEPLRAFGRAEGATLFMTLLAGFEALLHRYTGQTDFAVGTPVAGRTVSQTEGLIGLFVNTLVHRADLSDDPSFRALVRRVRASSLAAYAHQDLPFDHLVSALQPDRDPNRSPFFQVMLVLQNAPLPPLRSTGLTMTPVGFESDAAKFDLTLAVTEVDGGLRASMEYSADLFDPETVDRMLAHLETLLAAAVAEPDRPVAALPIMTEHEQRKLLGFGQAPGVTEADLANLSDDELDALINGV